MAEVVPAGLEVCSRPVGPKNTVCRYRTRDVMLNEYLRGHHDHRT
jgi:type VI secretion system protein ImpG